MQIEPRRSEGATLESDGVPVFVDAGTEAAGEYRRDQPVRPLAGLKHAGAHYTSAHG